MSPFLELFSETKNFRKIYEMSSESETECLPVEQHGDNSSQYDDEGNDDTDHHDGAVTSLKWTHFYKYNEHNATYNPQTYIKLQILCLSLLFCREVVCSIDHSQPIISRKFKELNELRQIWCVGKNFEDFCD